MNSKQITLLLVISLLPIVAFCQNGLQKEQTLSIPTRNAGYVIEITESSDKNYVAILFYTTNEYTTRLYKWENTRLIEIPLKENTTKAGTSNLQGNLLFSEDDKYLFFISPWASVNGWTVSNGTHIGYFKSDFGKESQYSDVSPGLLNWSQEKGQLTGSGFFYRENTFYKWNGPLDIKEIRKSPKVEWDGGKMVISQCEFLSDGKTALMANNNKFYIADAESGRINYESDKTKLISKIITASDNRSYIITFKDIHVFNAENYNMQATFPTQIDMSHTYAGSEHYLATIHKKTFDLIDGNTGQIILSEEHGLKGQNKKIYISQDETKLLVIVDNEISVYKINLS